ncbi:MAG: hypothetical protein K5984_00005, partial [Bacteroidales bacterium]|nr:hypothetical protein [Bacteroidales bacterium]
MKAVLKTLILYILFLSCFQAKADVSPLVDEINFPVLQPKDSTFGLTPKEYAIYRRSLAETDSL